MEATRAGLRSGKEDEANGDDEYTLNSMVSFRNYGIDVETKSQKGEAMIPNLQNL